MDHNSSKSIHLAPSRLRKRLGLPLTVVTDSHAVSVITCPDSGSDDNIISQKLADQLGLQVRGIEDPAPPTFVLANGRTVSAVGQAHLKCTFMKAFPDMDLIDCVFYVFQTLAVPMIMGIEFLHATETLTKHRDRLVEELVPSTQALRVCSVGRSKKDMVCRVGNYLGCATADTGSDLDLVSPEFAASRGFDVEESCVELEFADGSTGYTTGMIKTAISIGRVSDVKGFIPRSKELSVELFILDNLNADILVGIDTVQHLRAFRGHEDCFIPAMPRLGESDLNIIRYIGVVERGISNAWELLKDSFTSSENKKATATGMSSVFINHVQKCFSYADFRTTRPDRDHKRKWSQQHEQLLRDQMRNQIRLRPTDTGSREELSYEELSLPSLYDPLGSESLTPPLKTPPAMFKSPLERSHSRMSYELSPGSTNSLASRPHFCPVKGCPRAEGGRGFKRQIEMIRHGLVHESSGYVCPFCIDRQRKFLRPTALQRYVLPSHRQTLGLTGQYTKEPAPIDTYVLFMWTRTEMTCYSGMH